MSRRGIVAACLLPGCLACLAAGAGRPATQSAANRAAVTGHDVYRDVLAFNRRTRVDVYGKGGKRSPKWDAAAREFLEGMARHLSGFEVQPLLLAAFFLPAAPAPAAPPAVGPATKPGAVTNHDVVRALTAFNRRTSVDAYRRAGVRDPRWDAAAEKFLDGVARHFATGGMDVVYLPPDTPTREQLVLEGRKVIEAGCADPMVLYCVAAFLHDTDHAAEALPMLRRALAGLSLGTYGDYRVCAAAGRLARATPDPQERADAETVRHKAAVAMCCGKVDPDGRRKSFALAWEDLTTRDAQKAFVAALAARPDADPWIREVCSGDLHIQLAWDSRGSGFAHTVTPQGWKGFHEHLAVARDHLTRAWKLAPELPEAPTLMITVALGSGEQLGERVRVWFERAVAAQVDHTPAYLAMVQALLPRWGGSHEQMHDLALSCIREPRFDTLLPWQYVYIVERIGQDSQQPWGMLSQPEVYDNVVRVVEGYAKYLGGRDWAYKTYHAAAAWRTGRHEEAARVLAEIAAGGGKPQPHAFRRMGADDPAAAVSEVHARSGPHGAAIEAADLLLADGDARSALRSLRAVAAKLPKDDPGAAYLAARVKQVEWPLKFEGGEWVDIQPSPGLHGWKIQEGQWGVDADGALVGENEQRRSPKSLIWTAGDLGRNFEFAATLAFVPQPENGPRGSGGVMIFSEKNRRRGFVLVDHTTRRAGYLFGRDGHVAIETDVKDSAEVLVRCVDGTLTLEVDGRPIGDPFALPQEYEGGFQTGIGGIAGPPTKFTNLRVRKLRPPAKQAD